MKIILTLLLTIFSLQSMAARFAYTANKKTIVYADSALQVPIGYIKLGRKVKVGENSFKNKTITTIMVTGRVAYLKTEDLRFEIEGNLFSDAPQLKEHDVDILFMTEEDKLKKYNHLSLEASTLSLGTQWDTLVTRLGQADGASNALALSVKVEHLPPIRNYGFSFALSYLSASESLVKLDSVLLEIEYQYRLIQSDFLSIEALIGPLVTGEVRATTIDGEISDGAAFGIKYGARVRIMPFSKIGFFGSLEKYSMSINAFEPMTTVDINDYVLDKISGIRLAAGVSFAL